ncbi:hypothetical protein PWT90_09895 [Aphanocladium album]|nr:hypothetical protein PWT90_09895 [Aphanocladium album]
MQEYSTTDLSNICNDVSKQRSLFLCIFGSCQSRYYGPALASAILSCSGRGASICPLLPVEIQSEKLSSRQLSGGSGISGLPPNVENIHDFVIDHKFTLALDCNAGSDGVVTVSLSSPPTFATHIPQAAGFPEGQWESSSSYGSVTSAGPTMTQLQGRPALPSRDNESMTASGNDHSDQSGRPEKVASAVSHGIDSACEASSNSPSSVHSISPTSTVCSCSETTSASSQSVSSCAATAHQTSTHATATSSTIVSSTSSSCDEPVEEAMTTMSTTTRKSSSITSSTSSTPEVSFCEASTVTSSQSPRSAAVSSICSVSGETTYGANMHIPKLPSHSQASFSNATTTASSTMTSTITSTSSTASIAGTSTSTSCDTTSSLSTSTSSTSSSTSSVSTSSLKAMASSKGETSACSDLSSSSTSANPPSSSSSGEKISETLAASHAESPLAYTTENLLQAYGSFTPIALPSYVDSAPPEYGSVASVRATSTTFTSSSKSSVSSTSNLSTSVSTSSSSSTSTLESIPTYGYNFQAPSDTKTSLSTTSTAKATAHKFASEEDHPEGATSFFSSDPGSEVENTASNKSKSHIPGIETVPPPNKSSATPPSQAPATTQMLPIGGPPVLFVTIIEPDTNGNLETSVLTVSEESPWPTPRPDAKEGANALHARVDGFPLQQFQPNVFLGRAHFNCGRDVVRSLGVKHPTEYTTGFVRV